MKKNVLVVAVACGVLFGCSEKTEEKIQEKSPLPKDSTVKKVEPVEKKDTVVVEEKDEVVVKNSQNRVAENRVYDDYARFIGGLEPREGSLYEDACKVKTWKPFADKFDSLWKNMDKSRLAKMRTWGDSELVASRSTKTLLYPLSGPDFLNGFTLFPQTNRYILMALEPIGDVANPKRFTEKQVGKHIVSVENSLNDVFKKSYFITSHMNQDLQADRVNGTLPLLTLFMIKTGHKILSINKLSFDSTGNEIEDSLKVGDKHKPRAIKIYFVKEDEPDNIKTLVYIKADLVDQSFSTSSPLYKYLDKLENVNAYLKAASYVLHYRDFSKIRNLVLDKTDFLLQDDTGIAYRFFGKKTWSLQLYGKYVKPVKDFSGVDQEDLKKLYSSDKTVKKMPFSLGYHWWTHDQNMMRAIRIKK